MGFFETLKNKSAAKKAGLTYEQYLEYLVMAAEKGYSLDDYRMHLNAIAVNMSDEQYREYSDSFANMSPEQYLHFYKARSEGLCVTDYDVYLEKYQYLMSTTQYGDYLKLGESHMSIEEYIAYIQDHPQSNEVALELYITTQKAQRLNMTVAQYREYSEKYCATMSTEQFLVFCKARTVGLSLDQFLRYWRVYRDQYTLERYYQYCQAQKENLSLEQYDEWKIDYPSLSATRFRNLLEARRQNMTLEVYEELQCARQLGLTVEQYREKKLADSLGIQANDLPFYRACKVNQERGRNFTVVTSLEEVKIANKLRIKKIILTADKFKTLPHRAFWGCDAFREIVLPWGIREIGQYAFANCTALETITIPGSVKVLPRGVFDGCRSLRIIELLSGIEKVDITGWADLPALKTVASAGSIREFEIDKTRNYHKFSRDHWDSFWRSYNYNFDYSRDYGEESAKLNRVRSSVEILELEDERSIWKLENFPRLKVLILNTNNLEQFGLNQIKNCPQLHTIIINGADQTDYYTKSGSLRKRVEYKKELHVSSEGILHQLKFLIVKSNLLRISGGMKQGVDGIYRDLVFSRLCWLHVPSEAESISIKAPNLTEIGVSEKCSVFIDSIKRLLINEYVFDNSDVLAVWVKEEPVFDTSLMTFKRVDTGKRRDKLLIYRLDYTYSNGKHLECKELVVYEGATKIPKEFFAHGKFEKLSLPASLDAIESDAFGWCDNLKCIELRRAPGKVADDAFYHCQAIEEVTGVSLLEAKIGMNLPCLNLQKVKDIDFTCFSTVIPQSLFTGCAITELVIPAKIKTIEGRAFADAQSLTSIVFSGKMWMIAQDAFEGCTAVTSVVWKKPDLFAIAGETGFPNVKEISLPKDTQTIPEACFANWGLCKIIIPESVTIIESRAFAECKNLKSITFLGSPEQIAEDAFEGCTGVEQIEWGACTHFRIAGKTGFPNITQMVIPEGITDIPDNCFKNWGIQNLTIPQTVVSIGKNAFEECPISTINGEKGILRLTEKCQIASNAFSKCTFQTVVFDLAKLDKLAAVAKSVGAREIVVRDTIEINDFNRILSTPDITSISCIKTDKPVLVSMDKIQDMPATLQSVELPRSIGKLNFSIFDDCEALTALTIPESVELVVCEMGLANLNLQEITVPADLYYVALKEWMKPDTQITLSGEAHPEKYEITAVGEDAHLPKLGEKDHLLIQKVIIPEHCTSIAEGAFENLVNLRRVELNAPIRSVGARAFCGCERLEEILLPASVDTIGESAFEGCWWLDALDLPLRLHDLGAYAFSKTGLENVHIPDGIKRLPEGIFKGCAGLTSVTGMQNVGYVDQDAFSDSAVSDLVFSEEIFTIADAFKECLSLKRIFIPVNIAKLSVDLTECTSLQDLYLPQQIDEFSCVTATDNHITAHARRGSAWRKQLNVKTVDYIKNAEYDELIRIELEKAGLQRSVTAQFDSPVVQVTESIKKRDVGNTAPRRASWNTKSHTAATEEVFTSGPATVDELLEKMQTGKEQAPYTLESVECALAVNSVQPVVDANIYVTEETKSISNNIFTISLKCRTMPFPNELYVVLAEKNGQPASDMKKVKIAQEQCEVIGVQLQLNAGTANGEYYLITASQASVVDSVLSADICLVDIAFAMDMDFDF